MAQSIEHEKFFRRYPLTPADMVGFDTIAAESLAQLKDIEGSDEISFDEFLAKYFAQ